MDETGGVRLPPAESRGGAYHKTVGIVMTDADVLIDIRELPSLGTMDPVIGSGDRPERPVLLRTGRAGFGPLDRLTPEKFE